jgi:hypothetical protein
MSYVRFGHFTKPIAAEAPFPDLLDYTSTSIRVGTYDSAKLMTDHKELAYYEDGDATRKILEAFVDSNIAGNAAMLSQDPTALTTLVDSLTGPSGYTRITIFNQVGTVLADTDRATFPITGNGGDMFENQNALLWGVGNAQRTETYSVTEQEYFYFSFLLVRTDNVYLNPTYVRFGKPL